MKLPTLFKLLHLYSSQRSAKPSKTTGGFTIVEVVIVVLIIGVLSAIAAPSWLAFTSRQRTRTVNDGVFRALKSAQSEAKLDKRNIGVEFDVDADPPLIKIGNKDEKLNANGEIKTGMVDLVVAICNATDPTTGDCTGYDYFDGTTDYTITFNNLGAIEINNVDNLPVAVTTAIKDGKGAKRCVIVQTILGSMRTANDSDCPTPADW